MGDRQEGNRRLYSVDVRGLEALRHYLERYWDAALAAFADIAEEAEGGSR